MNKLLRNAIAFIICFNCFCAFAIVPVNQDSTNRITITDVYFGGTTAYTSFNSLSFSEMHRLTSRSLMLQTDLSKHEYYSYLGTSEGNVYFGLSLGKPLNVSDNYVFRLNAAFSLNQSNPLSATMSHNGSIPFDTLTSSQTGSVYYVKKIISDNYSIYYESNKFILNVNGVVSTNPLKRFSFYAGLGLSYGIGLSASTEISHNRNVYYSSGLYNNQVNDTINKFEIETLDSQRGYSVNVYVPLGVQFRFGKQAQFWKRFYMYFEFTGGIITEYIPELGNYTGFYPGTRFGYKYYIGKLD